MLLDILAIMVLVLASQITSKNLNVEISDRTIFGLETDVSFLAWDGEHWEVWDNGEWRDVVDGEGWRGQMFTVPCTLVCDQFTTRRHVHAEIMLHGKLASDISLAHINRCNDNKLACAQTVYRVSDTGLRPDDLGE